ncbi:MAG: maleylpyruvate isomerase family mycothiol-dependent enzyme [Acidimicrobiales bacterium]
MEPAEQIAAIEREAEALITAAERAPEAAVPSCPGWTVDTLVNHLGRVHRWATEIVLAGGDPPQGFPPRPELADAAWFREGAANLRRALTATDPDAPCWTFLGQGTARFWFRRQTLETAVHRWDVEESFGAAGQFDTALAVDGVAEIFEMHLPRLLAGHDAPDLPLGSLHVHATDSPEGEWILERSDDGQLVLRHGHEKGDAAVRASAGDLLLWGWGRGALAGLEVVGDAEVAQAWTRVITR